MKNEDIGYTKRFFQRRKYMERVLIISYVIGMILTAGFIYCIYREKYWVLNL